jgi:hypothetical protein
MGAGMTSGHFYIEHETEPVGYLSRKSARRILDALRVPFPSSVLTHLETGEPWWRVSLGKMGHLAYAAPIPVPMVEMVGEGGRAVVLENWDGNLTPMEARAIARAFVQSAEH